MIDHTPISQEEIDQQLEEMRLSALWQAGEYKFDTAAAKEGISKTSGHPMITLQLLFHKPTGETNYINDYFTFPPKAEKENAEAYNKYIFAMSKFKSYCESVGLLEYYLSTRNVDCFYIMQHAKRGLASLKLIPADGQYAAKVGVNKYLKPVEEVKIMDDDIPF